MGRHTGDRVCALGSHIVPCLACSLSFVSFHIEPAGELGLSRHPNQVSMYVTVVAASLLSLPFCAWGLPLQYIPRHRYFILIL